MNMQNRGWNQHFEQAFQPYESKGWIAGRICVHHRAGRVVSSQFVLRNKVDLCDDPETVLAETPASLPGVDVHAVSGERDEEGSGGPAEDALDTFEDIEALAQNAVRS